jgi:hypothetical protein
VITERSAKSTAQTVENLRIIVETTEYCRSNSSSVSSGITTCHTALFSQENCTTDTMKESENVLKSRRNSEQKLSITDTWQGRPSVQETPRQSSQCSGDNFIVKRTSESLCYKMETVHHTNSNCIIGQRHLPEKPNPSQNVYREESIKSVLQEDPDLHNGSGRIQGCQQIKGNNSGHPKNCTGLYRKLEDNEMFVKNEESCLRAKTEGPDNKNEIESDSQACRAKSSDIQENSLAEEVCKLQLDGHKVVDPFDRTLIQQLLSSLGFPGAGNNKCYVNLNMQVPQFKIGGTVNLGKFLL